MELLPLSGDQVDYLKKSFRQLDSSRLGHRFYSHLFQQYPHLQKMFSSDMNDQIAKIVSVFELVVFSFEEREHNKFWIQNSVVVPLRELGKRHADLGVLDDHYPIANNLLIQSIHEELGDLFLPSHEVAWKLALEHLTYAMQNKSVGLEKNKNKNISLRESFAYIKRILTGSGKK